MNLKTYIRSEIIPVFFISTACITLLMAIVGTSFDPEAKFGYEVLFSPFVYGFAAALINFIRYSRKELTPGQTLVRKVLHLAALEAGIMSILYFVGGLRDTVLNVTLALSVPAVYAAVTAVMWVINKRSCDAVNSALKTLQKKAENG